MKHFCLLCNTITHLKSFQSVTDPNIIPRYTVNIRQPHRHIFTRSIHRDKHTQSAQRAEYYVAVVFASRWWHTALTLLHQTSIYNYKVSNCAMANTHGRSTSNDKPNMDDLYLRITVTFVVNTRGGWVLTWHMYKPKTDINCKTKITKTMIVWKAKRLLTCVVF